MTMMMVVYDADDRSGWWLQWCSLHWLAKPFSPQPHRPIRMRAQPWQLSKMEPQPKLYPRPRTFMAFVDPWALGLELMSQPSTLMRIKPLMYVQAYCYQYNPWLQADTYFWVEVLVTTSNVTEWVNKVTVEVTEAAPDSWAAKVELCKGLRAYACENNLKVGDVSGEDLEATKLGIKGWAKLYDSLPAARPRPGSDGSTKPAAKAAVVEEATSGGGSKKRSKAQQQAEPVVGLLGEIKDENAGDGETKPKQMKKDQTASKKEREAKDFLAAEQSSDNCMAGIAVSMAKDPEAWSWARELVAKYKRERGLVVQDYANNEAFQQLKVAALSPRETAKVKKQYGEHYVGKLVEFITTLGPKIQAMSETSFQISQMATAKREASDSIRSTPKPKSKAKAKAKGKAVKRQASSNSLAGSA